MEEPRERQIGEDAGPLVRPYALTRGRTRPRGVRVDVVAILVTTGGSPSGEVRLSPEQRRLLALCRVPSTTADLASEVGLPLGVIQVLLGDLIHHGLLEEQRRPAGSVTTADRPDPRLLERVLNDLRAL